MKVVMTGGGSGGHITPILAVAHEVKQADPKSQVIYIGQKGDTFAEVASNNPIIDESFLVSAGKFRRYHGEGIRQLLDLQTVWLNIKDAFRVVVGLFQSYQLLGQLQPDVVFCKGGFVGVPVGLAAALRRIPYITHDSDAIPGLANRIISRWAVKHAVALKEELYPYDKSKTINVGVPVAETYRYSDGSEKHSARQKLGYSDTDKILLITGGGLGASRLNHAAVSVMKELLDRYNNLKVIHTTGVVHEKVVREAYEAALGIKIASVKVIGYTTELFYYSAASDLVVARGGATNIAELAMQGKASIIVPNPLLTGGHQLKNAVAYQEAGAVVVIDESGLKDNPEVLATAIRRLLDDDSKRQQLGEALHGFARPNAAKDIANILIEVTADSRGLDEASI